MGFLSVCFWSWVGTLVSMFDCPIGHWIGATERGTKTYETTRIGRIQSPKDNLAPQSDVSWACPNCHTELRVRGHPSTSVAREMREKRCDSFYLMLQHGPRQESSSIDAALAGITLLTTLQSRSLVQRFRLAFLSHRRF